MTTSTVDLEKAVQATTPKSLGMVSSGYGANPTSSAAQAVVERALDARFIRIPGGYRNGKVVTTAGGGSALDLPAIVRWYQSVGFDVEVVCGGHTNDTDLQAGDATAMLKALGSVGVSYTTPNEPNNSGHSVQEAIAWGKMINNETKLPVTGPVWSYFDLNTVLTFAKGLGAGALGAVDYHHYAMGSKSLDTGTALNGTPGFGREAASVIAGLKAAGLPTKTIVDELNFSWRYGDGTPGGNNRFFTAVNTVWIASACGHILAAGACALPYASQNGPLGITVQSGSAQNPDNRQPSTPMPAYWGIAAFTGARQFSHYKDTFYAVSNESDPNIETFALNNEAGGFNIILINKNQQGAAQHVLTVNKQGTYDVWQTNPSKQYDPPAKIVSAAALSAAGTITVTLPALSVTTVVLAASGTVTPPVIPPVVPPSTYRINAGGGSVAGWNSVSSLVAGGAVASNPGVAAAPTGIPAALFTTERWGEQVYTLPVSGPSKVTLLFCEQFPADQATGKRLFNITVNGIEAEANFDVWSRAGAKVGAVASVVVTTAPDAQGNVVIALTNGTSGSPFINALLVDPVVATPPTVSNLPANATLAQAATVIGSLPATATVEAVTAVNALLATLRQTGTIS